MGPLKGVVIAVAKKLSKQQSEYNNTAAALGADYRWTYDQSCTHFIFQVRLCFFWVHDVLQHCYEKDRFIPPWYKSAPYVVEPTYFYDAGN